MKRLCACALVTTALLMLAGEAAESQLNNAVAPCPPPQGTFVKSKRVHAQYFAIEASAGLVTYSGDVDIAGTFTSGRLKWKPLLLAAVHGRIISPASFIDVGLVLAAEYCSFEAVSDEYDFVTPAFSASAALKFEFFPTSPLRPYVSGGCGMLFFDPDVTIKSPGVQDRYHQFRGTSTSTFTIPLTVGILWTLGKNVDFIYKFNKTLAFTDNLDGWEAEYKDNYQSFIIGLLYYF